MGKSTSGRKAARLTLVLIPGGPGLTPGYMLPWARATAKAIGARVVALDYSVFSRHPTADVRNYFADCLRKLACTSGREAPRGKVVLCGHSFGARLVIELLRLEPTSADAAVLLNCPGSFAPSDEFERRKRRLLVPAQITTESDFRAYWRATLPLYFNSRPKNRWIDILSHGTNWMGTGWLTSEVEDSPRTLSRASMPPLLFVNGRGDIRFPQSNSSRLQRSFPSAQHVHMAGTGHFPMLENPRALTGEIISFLSAQKLVDLQSAP